MRVFIHEEAAKDLVEIAGWPGGVSGRAADRFLGEFDAALVFISEHPYAGHPSGRFRRRNLERFDYHFLYLVIEEKSEVWLMVVRHDSRHPEYGAESSILPEDECQ